MRLLSVCPPFGLEEACIAISWCIEFALNAFAAPFPTIREALVPSYSFSHPSRQVDADSLDCADEKMMLRGTDTCWPMQEMWENYERSSLLGSFSSRSLSSPTSTLASAADRSIPL